jgi:hypothetical protein
VVKDIETLKKLVDDDFFKESAVPDEEAITDMGSVVRSIGWEEVHVRDGRAVDV